MVVKNRYNMVFESKEKKYAMMMNEEFTNREKMAMVDLYLVLDKSFLFSISSESSAKGHVWGKIYGT